MRPVSLARALSRLGAASRSRAVDLIRDGRVRVDDRIVRDPAFPVQLTLAHIEVGGQPCRAPIWRTILFHKPRGVVTTARDPEGRRTVFDVLGASGRGLKAVGRLDLATSGVLLLTTDTRLSDWLTDPVNAIARLYVVTVRGRIGEEDMKRLTTGLSDSRGAVRAAAVTPLKVSNRESHVLVELRQGRNREVRRLFAAVDHEVTRLKRVAFGGLELEDVPPGAWRELQPRDLVRAFGPNVPIADSSRRSTR